MVSPPKNAEAWDGAVNLGTSITATIISQPDHQQPVVDQVSVAAPVTATVSLALDAASTTAEAGFGGLGATPAPPLQWEGVANPLAGTGKLDEEPDISALAGAQTFRAPKTAGWLFDPLPKHSYNVLVIDPPWTFKTYSPKGQRKSASRHYPTMSLDEIKALPVHELLADDAEVYLWTIAPLLDEAMATLKGWGMTYVSHLGWRKVSRNGKMQWGTGYRVRSCSETILVGTVGKPPCLRLPSCFDGLRREHSRKPDEFYDMLKKKTPGLRRADVFAREKREGWDAWGNEVGKFSSAPTAATSNAMVGDDEQLGARP
jgi:N6-adenosine-specific RNA methylase IME4